MTVRCSWQAPGRELHSTLPSCCRQMPWPAGRGARRALGCSASERLPSERDLVCVIHEPRGASDVQLAHDWVLASTPLDGQSLEGLMCIEVELALVAIP